VPTQRSGLIRGIRTIPAIIGRRGVCLLFLAILDIIYAYGLANPTPRSLTNPTTLFLIDIMPLVAWAVIWGTVGACCVIFAFQPRPRDIPAFVLAIGLKTFWALVFLGGQVVNRVERGYLSTTIWGAFALFILVIAGWRENNEH